MESPEEKKNIESPKEDTGKEGKKKHHLIKSGWLRIPLKVIMWIIISVIFIFVLIYIPPVQTLVKNIACSVVKKSTGMDISIDKFRLKWPLDVSLQGVSIVEATGDTMVYAKEVIADVRLAPLLKLDIDLNELQLKDAGFRMLTPDSAILIKVKAALIDIDDKSSVDIKTLDINLNKILLKDGSLSLMMDVWKQKPTPEDSTGGTLPVIRLGDVLLDNFRFGMGMLPTIDTLSLTTASVRLRNGLIDLPNNKITASYLGTQDGNVQIVMPTPEYIESHPLPVSDSEAPASPPMVIVGDTVEVVDFKALYAVKDARPLPGFDPSYIQFDNVTVRIDSLYNAAADIKLPIREIRATERCGLDIIEGHGTFAMDSTGMNLEDLFMRTPFTFLSVDASVPFALMEMKPWAPFEAMAHGEIGWPDVESFMPDLVPFTKKIPRRDPIEFNLNADGSLENIKLRALNAGIKDILNVKAEGYAMNALDFKKMKASIDFKGNVTGPKIINNILNLKDFKLPVLDLTGHASADRQNYAADFKLKTSIGDLMAIGKVNLNSENYKAALNVRNIDINNFVPDMGLGKINASLKAQGGGFNPTRPHATADIGLKINSIEYNDHLLSDITLDVLLKDGIYKIDAQSPNDDARFHITCDGTVAPDNYTFDLTAMLDNIDLYGLGITKDENFGSGRIILTGNAQPEKWMYDADLVLSNLEWNIGNQYYGFPGSFNLKFNSTADEVNAGIYAKLTAIDFESKTGLKDLISSFEVVGDSVSRQIARRDLNVEYLQHALPPFNLSLKASGNGIVGEYLGGLGLSVDTVYAHFANDSIITGNMGIIEIGNSGMRADTLTFNLRQRGQLLDYRAHMGNRKNNPIGDFANVNLNGYIGSNRLMLGVIQKNQKNETGYRLGLTAAFVDSLVTVHFTPLKATIGYIPWVFNDDNHVDVNLKNFRIDADLMAHSKTSSILLKTEKNSKGNDELHLALDNIKIQDFLQLSLFAPPITADLNVDLNVGYENEWLYGTGNMNVTDFTYDKLRVGDFDLTMRAGLNDGGTTGARLGLKIDGEDAVAAKMVMAPDSSGTPEVKTFCLELTRFPLKIANPFLGKDILSLSGYLNGDFDLTGSLKQPKLNGFLACDSVGVYIPMMASSVRFNQDSILVNDNIIDFNKFNIYGANKNPIVVDGTVDINQLSAVMFNLRMDANNFQLMNNDNRARSELYGKLMMDLHASARGPMQHFSVNADVKVLPNTNVTYSIPQMTAQLSQHNTTDIVKFVNFNDTLQIAKTDSVTSALAMRIVADLTLEPGMEVTVIYPGTTTTGNARIELSPSGTLNYFQNYMGDMRLNGQLYLGNGFARYSMPIVGEKKFVFNPQSNVLWNGDLLNPVLNISATDNVKASVVENGNSRLVNFIVGLDVTNNLAHPNILFNLSTDDDITIRNQLMTMSADQRSMAALNMLITGQYSGQGVTTASGDLLQGTMYNLLTSQINSWLANNVHGVDLSLGVDQYDRTVNGETGTSTSYSYTVSKSLFNNRFKISVGGNYTTDASADENFSENLISDISFEYILKQTTNVTMYARLFRHTGYESILEGEITETGVGFLLRRRLANLKDLFRWGAMRNRMASPVYQGLNVMTRKDTLNQVSDTVSPGQPTLDPSDMSNQKNQSHDDK